MARLVFLGLTNPLQRRMVATIVAVSDTSASMRRIAGVIDMIAGVVAEQVAHQKQADRGQPSGEFRTHTTDLGDRTVELQVSWFAAEATPEPSGVAVPSELRVPSDGAAHAATDGHQ